MTAPSAPLDRDAVIRRLHDYGCPCTSDNCNHLSDIERAFEAGQAHERAAVVGWLQRCDDGMIKHVRFKLVADAISRGAHHTKGKP